MWEIKINKKNADGNVEPQIQTSNKCSPALDLEVRIKQCQLARNAKIPGLSDFFDLKVLERLKE